MEYVIAGLILVGFGCFIYNRWKKAKAKKSTGVSSGSGSPIRPTNELK